MDRTAAYLDPRSGRTYPLDVPRWCGDGGAHLNLGDAPDDVCERLFRVGERPEVVRAVLAVSTTIT